MSDPTPQQSFFGEHEGQPSLADLTCKLDRLLRLFKMVKATDYTLANETRDRAKNIVKQMEIIDALKYKQIEDKINTCINQSLSEPVKKKAPQIKVAASSIAVSGTGKHDPKVSGSFGSVIEHRGNETQKQSSISLFPKSSADASIDYKQQKRRVAQKQKEVAKQKDRDIIIISPEKPTPKFSIDFKKQSSAEMSGSLSDTFKTNSNLREYCQVNGGNIESKIAINEEVINYFKTQSPDKVSLLGVQKPHDKNTDKLYICTYMEFMKEQVTSIKFKTKNFQNELDQFLNVLRYPLALCVIGQSISDMKIHYVKFLLEMTSPLPLVLIYNQVAPDKSLIVRMSDKVISSVDNCNIIEMDRLDSQINMKDKSKYKCTSLKEVQVVKDKCVTTKPLFRKINHEIIENDQAIMIQKCSKGSGTGINVAASKKTEEEPASLISLVSQGPSQQIQSVNSIQVQESSGTVQLLSQGVNPIQFNYKIHSKFMATICTDFFVYLITEDKQMLCRKKTKTLEQSIEFVKNSKSLCVLGCTMKSAQKQIPSMLFSAQLKLLNICPMILIRLRSLNLNRAVFVTVKPETSEEVFTNTVVNYKKVEEDSCPFLHLLISGQKNELLCYESEKPIVEI